MTDFTNMKIAFIHEYSQNFVGQERSLMERLIGLKELGIQCEVLLPGSGLFCDLLKKEGFQVRFYSLNHLTKKNPFPYFKTVLEISRLIKANKYSILHCSGAYPNQTIYTKESLDKCFIKFADYIITVSEGARQKILRETHAPPDKVKTIYNGIGNGHNVEYLNSGQRLKKSFHIDAKTKIVGQIGSLVPRKGYEYFIEMAKIVKKAYPDVKFFMVGPSREEAHELLLKKKITRLNLQDDIILAGFQENPYPFIDMFDISVLASTAEGLGRVIVESQKMGKPVIGTNIIGMNEAIIDHKTGLLVPPRDPQALADAVLELLVNPQEANELALQGQKSAFEKFDQRKHARLVCEVYQSLRRG